MNTLRKLRLKDAEPMLKWMHDIKVTNKYMTDFGKYTIGDAEHFILHSFSEDNQHFAVVDEKDEYIGTISLKNISKFNKNAEIASVFIEKADKKERLSAVKKIIAYAFEKLELEEVYVHVFEDDTDMIDNYSKLGFLKGGTFISRLYIRDVPRKLCWYYIRKAEDIKENHRMLYFQERGDIRGHMVVIEELKDVPFQIKRLFYIYGSDENVKRGLHANRKSEFVLVNVSGSSKVKVFDGKTEQIYELMQPHTGVYLPKMVWKEMYDFSENSVLLVLSNEIYDPDEYIRSLEEYMMEMSNE